jgi:uncharacterized protein YbcI
MEAKQDGKTPSQQISTRAVQLLHEYTGRGPTKAKTTINQDSVLIVLGDTLTKGERQLVEAGKADHVLTTRHEFQLVMRDDLVELVESHVQRKVVAFMSDNHIDPDVAAEVFILEAAAEPAVSR